MDAERVEILHRSHGKAAVGGIPDDLKLNFLPALETFLDEDLRGEGEGRFGDFAECLLVRADA